MMFVFSQKLSRSLAAVSWLWSWPALADLPWRSRKTRAPPVGDHSGARV